MAEPTYPPGADHPLNYSIFPEKFYGAFEHLDDVFTLRDLFMALALPSVILRNTDPNTPAGLLSQGHVVPVVSGVHAYDAATIADSCLYVRHYFPVIGQTGPVPSGT